jgi:Ca2+-binding EF-hand superfamily protein
MANESDNAMNKAIRKYALENAIKFNGTATPSAIVGKIMGEFPDARKDSNMALMKITEIVNAVNSIPLEDQKNEVLNYNSNYFDNQKQEKEKNV